MPLVDEKIERFGRVLTGASQHFRYDILCFVGMQLFYQESTVGGISKSQERLAGGSSGQVLCSVAPLHTSPFPFLVPRCPVRRSGSF